jgi:hypothetical protein
MLPRSLANDNTVIQQSNVPNWNKLNVVQRRGKKKHSSSRTNFGLTRDISADVTRLTVATPKQWRTTEWGDYLNEVEVVVMAECGGV